MWCCLGRKEALSIWLIPCSLYWCKNNVEGKGFTWGAGHLSIFLSLTCLLPCRMLTFSNNVEPANGFLVRYLRRKLLESDSDANANREELLRVLDWVPKLWYHLHTFLEKHSTSDFLIGKAWAKVAGKHCHSGSCDPGICRKLFQVASCFQHAYWKEGSWDCMGAISCDWASQPFIVVD